MGGDRIGFVTPDGLGPAMLKRVVEALLTVLRDDITEAWLDAPDHHQWPAQADAECLLALEQRQRQTQTGLGVELDLLRDDQFSLLVRLSTVATSAEAWAGPVQLCAVSDRGRGAYTALTPDQASEVAFMLAAAGLAFEDVLRPQSG